jgi:hypothetical protein
MAMMFGKLEIRYLNQRLVIFRFGNNRGNRYGRNHTTLDPDDGTNSFWAFTWDEMGLIDAPTMIHYVLDTTGHSSLSGVGHSEGTIQMFAAG